MADFTGRNFTSPQPSLPPPSPSPSSRDPDRSSWYIPGPSSKYNTKHDRNRSQNSFFYRTYTPVAPVLSTERRSHRRAQSSASVPTLKSSLLSPTDATAPARSPLSRIHSHTSASMASTAHTHFHGPVTPAAKYNNSSRPNSKLQDSPFSDYFTDDGRENMDSAFSVPSQETQHLLVRLNKLQSLLMRREDDHAERNAINIIDKKIGEIELQLSTAHSQTRLPAEMEDSGLFMEEEDEEQDEDSSESKNETPLGIHNIPAQTFEAAAAALLAAEITPENRKAENDWVLLEAQKVFENVKKANEQLRLRCDEIKEMNERHNLQMEEKEQETENLKNENETLITDLGFDQTELLFLKLQHKALEVEVEALDNGARRLETYVPEIRDDIHKVKQARIKREMRRWDAAWDEVDRRMKERRSKYRVLSSSASEASMAAAVASPGEIEPADWQLETVKEDDGQVQRITIKRTSTADGMAEVDGTADHDSEKEQAVQSETPQDDHSAEFDESVEPSPASEKTRPNYTDQTTQTEPLAPIPPAWSPLFVDEDEDNKTTTTHAHADDGDCAITTSSEDNDDYEDDLSTSSSDAEGEAEPATEPSVKTALKDLWDGLASYAGMGEERF